MSPDDLVQFANRLNELGRLMVRSIIEWNPESLTEHIGEFDETKRTIQAHLIQNSSIELPGEHAKDARALLERIARGDLLPIEQALRNIGGFGLSDEDYERIGSDELYSWMSHVEYAQGLQEAGALIVNAGALPKNLDMYLSEARSCFAFQQYRAVCALSRAMLEISVKDIAHEYKILPADHGNVAQIASRRHVDLNKWINKVTHLPQFSSLRGKLHELREETNRVIHGGGVIGKDEALSTLKRTLSVIHLLYEADTRHP